MLRLRDVLRGLSEANHRYSIKHVVVVRRVTSARDLAMKGCEDGVSDAYQLRLFYHQAPMGQIWACSLL